MNLGISPINIGVIGGKPGVSKNEVVFTDVTDKKMDGLDFSIYHHMGYNFVGYFPNTIECVIGVSNSNCFAERGTL